MGRQIGTWKLKNTLGSGSFGEVKFATNSGTGRQAAAKICAKQSLSKGQGRTLLQREIATMKELNHPNVLKLYEVLETSRHYYLILELASGGELFDLIQENKRFGDSTARRYFQQLILGVKYCHEQGIVHRDLKPQNLLFTANDELKIADFGFSNFQNLDQDGKVTPALRLQTQCGTPNYAAPEIFLGKGYDGFKTDLWSCGVILYVMLCGHVPFRPTGKVGGLQGVIMSIVECRYTIPDGVSDGARDLIKKILRKDTESRFTLGDVVGDSWFDVDFDRSRAASLPKIVVTDESILTSIKTNVEEKEVDPLLETVPREDDDTASPGAGAVAAPEICDALPAPRTDPLAELGGGAGGAGGSRPPSAGPALAGGLATIFADPPPGCDQLGRTLKQLRPNSAATLVAMRSQMGKKPATRTAHVFQRKHWNSPHWCFYCKKFIYGVGRQGFSCVNCQCPVHVKCVENASSNCCCEEFRFAGSPIRGK